LSGVPIPSIVVIDAPSATLAIFTTQDRINFPSMIMLHEPHWPSPQPTLTPVSPNWSRNTAERGVSAWATTSLGIPFTKNVLLSIRPSSPKHRRFQVLIPYPNSATPTFNRMNACSFSPCTQCSRLAMHCPLGRCCLFSPQKKTLALSGLLHNEPTGSFPFRNGR
jgi:hypothetical protein